MRIDILGVGFDNVTLTEAADRAMELFQEPGPHMVVTPNPEIVELCRTRRSLRRTVNSASLVLPDGIGVILAASILRTPLKERTPGVEFAALLMERMAGENRSLYLLGAKPGVAAQAGTRLKERYPGLTIAGTHDGYFTDDDAVTEEIRNSGAEAVFVCLGAPKQELWMATHAEETGARVLCGLGGALDIFAGTAVRAPKFFCDHGLEWLYRLYKEPRRFKRMLKLPLFLFHVLGERLRRRKKA